MSFKKFFLPVIFAVLMASSLFFWFRRDNTTEEIRERKIPQTEFRTLEGKTINLGGEDVPLIVNVWATWCPFCLKEMESFAELEKKFAGKIKVVLVNRGEDASAVMDYIHRIPQLASTTTVALDEKDAFYSAIGGFSMPETLFVDAKGIIRYHKRGPMEWEEIKRRAEELL
ncbi:MAG: TlpA family protein disulfide reductase [Candidatus Sungbacteria bacterium]|nr:TlpA family protein disulfide reductase [Candidatus Sungbacteria bacterium]